MTDVKLSICIPTYNRAAYLRNALEYCADYAFGFAHEIVISDNASTDDTSAVVEEFIARGLPIRYFRRSENGGSVANLSNAFHHASGEYSVYLADDDLLIPDAVANVVRYLDANPDVVACHTPWTLYDEVNDRDLSQFYQVPEDRKFERHDFFDVFRFLFEGHVFPEIYICRSSALRTAWAPREFCFYAFSHLAHFLDMGAVAFLKQPFYRSVAVSKLAANRQQAGFDDVLTSWDRYRGGLEYFLHIGSQRGALDMSDEACAVYAEMCRLFTLERMSVAIRLWYARRDYIKTYELCTRMALGGQRNHPEVAKIAETLPVLVGFQTLAHKIGSTSDIDSVIIGGADEPDEVGAMLYATGLSPRIVVFPDTMAEAAGPPERCAVFLTDETARATYLARGHKPNLIFSEIEMLRHVMI